MTTALLALRGNGAAKCADPKPAKRTGEGEPQPKENAPWTCRGAFLFRRAADQPKNRSLITIASSFETMWIGERGLSELLA
jgi:hypothetical protein